MGNPGLLTRCEVRCSVLIRTVSFVSIPACWISILPVGGSFYLSLVAYSGLRAGRMKTITPRHQDLACSTQLVLEETLLHLARHLKKVTKEDRLCLAGGVAYNCVANSRLWREAGFVDLFVPPAAGDSGAALGAALWLTHRKAGISNRMVMRTASWGPQFSEQTCRAALEEAGLEIQRLEDPVLCEKVAGELAAGRLVFWFQGRMEWGPRALGNRSLLADPRREDMRALINAKVKLREPFRPFAPSVLEERAARIF